MNWPRTAFVTSLIVRPYARSCSGSDLDLDLGLLPADHDDPADALDRLQARAHDVVGDAVQSGPGRPTARSTAR